MVFSRVSRWVPCASQKHLECPVPVRQSNLNHHLISELKRRMPIGKRSEGDIFFLAFALSSIIFLVPISMALEWAQLHASAFTTLAGLALVTVSIGVWRNTQQLKTALLVYELTLLALILVNAFMLGGVTSPVMVWLGIVPLLPLFIASMKWAYAFLALAFIAVLLFYGLSISTTFHLSPASPTEQLFAAFMFGTFIMAQTVLISTVQGITANRSRKIAKDNQRLRAVTEQMSLAHEHKDKFLSHVSHEMRTPLNVIHGYLELLHNRQDLPDDAHEQVEQLYSASTHMLSLVNDLLDYSQIHQGQFTLAIQPVELPTLIHQVFGTLQHQAHQKNLDWVYNESPTLPRWVQTDPTRLTQILLNLLGNAIKFTSQGQVQLDVSYSPSHQMREATLHIVVSDTGPGIPTAVLNKIFAPFYQLHPQQVQRKGQALQGNGLGLAITHGLVKNWQGKIDVHSTVGKGTTFHVTLPLTETSPVKPSPALQSKPTAEPTTLPLRILVVDDHTMNRMVASATIRKHLPDCQVEQAENGHQALQKMATELYDVVLLDVVMPDLSGIEVLQTVRQTYPEPYRNVRTIAFTANVEADIKNQCERTGFDGFLSKPFNVHTLMHMLKPIDPNLPASSVEHHDNEPVRP